VPRITVSDTGESFECPEGQFVIHAMIRSRKGPVKHGCCGGGCGVCKMKVVSGSYDVVKKMSQAHVTPADQENGTVLICCIQPRTDLVLSRV